MIDGAAGRVAVDDQEIVVASGMPGMRDRRGRTLALRPEAILLDDQAGGRNQLKGTIEEVSFLGSVVRVRVRFQENRISIDTFNNPGMRCRSAANPVTVSFARRTSCSCEHRERR